MRIGTLARQANTGIETIRYYERIGLMPPPSRTESGQRDYDSTALTHLLFIRRCRMLDFSLEETRALLDVATDKKGACETVMELARKHRREVRSRLAELKAMDQALTALLKDCSGNRTLGCPAIETLMQHGYLQEKP